MQSTPLPAAPLTLNFEGCPSLRNSDRFVVSKNFTRSVTATIDVFCTANSGGIPPGYVVPSTGSVCPRHLSAFVSFHFLPL
ncbi:hypothetical protein SLA2020_341650 [Shorea laevis]